MNLNRKVSMYLVQTVFEMQIFQAYTQSNFFDAGCNIMWYNYTTLYNIIDSGVIYRRIFAALSPWTTVFAVITVHNLISI